MYLGINLLRMYKMFLKKNLNFTKRPDKKTLIKE